MENILQILSMEKKSCTMSVVALDRIGYLYVEKGELIDAFSGELSGHDAALEILCWEEAQCELFTLAQRSRNIDVSLMSLLLQASKEKDERKKHSPGSPLNLLEQSIEQAEAHLYRSAHVNLLRYLKKNRKNASGWVWYSRIHADLQVVEKALKNAMILGPDDPLVREETAKFAAAKKRIQTTAIRKCYFCWTPLDKKLKRCHHCAGFLRVDTESLELVDRPNSGTFIAAIRRYSRVSAKYPESLAALYCLSLAHLNMGHLKEALHCLDQLSKKAPDNTMFSRQLNLLMDYLAATASSAVTEAEEQPMGANPSAGPPEQLAIQQKKNILVVEDSPTIRKVITISLKRNGYGIVEAGDGLEALSRVSHQKPDLILLDVVLPKMDGFKLLSLLKGNRELKSIPIIMLTSKDGFINKVKGKMGGADAYLTKPFDPQKMIDEIQKHI
ncbi:response regulator [Desulfogranum mediterraneum]|uniref:response regulator n=1 Tax=Desulfogranum mediterraneum TaxID=160661 RepID=UPI001376B651|nr:response regulator [Desulfogranum mediterraneum]